MHRILLIIFYFINILGGCRGFSPGPHTCEASSLPLSYTPAQIFYFKKLFVYMSVLCVCVCVYYMWTSENSQPAELLTLPKRDITFWDDSEDSISIFCLLYSRISRKLSPCITDVVKILVLPEELAGGETPKGFFQKGSEGRKSLQKTDRFSCAVLLCFQGRFWLRAEWQPHLNPGFFKF